MMKIKKTLVLRTMVFLILFVLFYIYYLTPIIDGWSLLERTNQYCKLVGHNIKRILFVFWKIWILAKFRVFDFFFTLYLEGVFSFHRNFYAIEFLNAFSHQLTLNNKRPNGLFIEKKMLKTMLFCFEEAIIKRKNEKTWNFV